MWLKLWLAAVLLLRLADVGLTAALCYRFGIDGERNPLWQFLMLELGIVPALLINLLFSSSVFIYVYSLVRGRWDSLYSAPSRARKIAFAIMIFPVVFFSLIVVNNTYQFLTYW